MKYILSVSFLIFSLLVNGQCKGFAKDCKKDLKQSYMPTGQSTNKELAAGERYQYITTFYEGQNYRIYGCSDSALGDIQLTIRNTRRQLYYDNSGKGSKTFDFKVGSTQQLIVTLVAPESESNNSEEIKGCVAALVGIKF